MMLAATLVRVLSLGVDLVATLRYLFDLGTGNRNWKVSRMLLIILAALSMMTAQTPRLPPDFAEKLAALEKPRVRLIRMICRFWTRWPVPTSMAAEYRKPLPSSNGCGLSTRRITGVELRLARNYTWAGDARRAMRNTIRTCMRRRTIGWRPSD
jgi:hypothetical protein